MQGAPDIGVGVEVSGFPVVWIGTKTGWYSGVDLNLTMALRRTLQQALFKVQNHAAIPMAQDGEVSSLILGDKGSLSLDIPAYEERKHSENLQSAMEVLERNGKRLLVVDLGFEPFLKEEQTGVFGVIVRGEESR
jgi:hypothetical protein